MWRESTICFDSLLLILKEESEYSNDLQNALLDNIRCEA